MYQTILQDNGFFPSESIKGEYKHLRDKYSII